MQSVAIETRRKSIGTPNLEAITEHARKRKVIKMYMWWLIIKIYRRDRN